MQVPRSHYELAPVFARRLSPGERFGVYVTLV